MLRIRHKRGECIGCDVCVDVAPDYWFMDEEGLAQLHAVKARNKGFEFGEGFDADRERLEDAARDCPVSIIRVE